MLFWRNQNTTEKGQPLSLWGVRPWKPYEFSFEVSMLELRTRRQHVLPQDHIVRVQQRFELLIAWLHFVN